MKIKYSFLFLLILFVSCNSNKYQQRYLVTTDTMCPTINPGDYVIDDSSIKEFTYGDIIGYEYTLGDKKYKDVFRIVGLPGDSIAVDKGICIVNGKKNNYKYIRERKLYHDEWEEELPNGLKIVIEYYPLELDNGRTTDYKTVKIPLNYFFILGDYRTVDLDSRYFGAIPKDEIIGKVVKIIKAE